MASDSITLGDVLAATGGNLQGSATPGLTLGGVSADSRTVRPGDLFVALRGQKHDGHSFVAEAFARGAPLALVERVPTEDVLTEADEGPPLVVVPSTPRALRRLASHWLECHPARMVVIVGSVGKGTTTELVAAVLAQRGGVLRASALQRPEISVPMALLRLRGGTSRVALELGLSGAGDVPKLLEVARPQVVVVTNVEPNRLEPTLSLEELAAPKAALVEALPAEGTAVLNADDRLVRLMAGRTSASSILYGLGSEADVRAENVAGHGLHGMELELCVAQQRVHVRLPLLGLNSVHAALAAAAVGLAEGQELREIGAALQSSSGDARIIAVTGLNGSRVIDDSYNASPESDLEALNLLAGLGGRKIAVLGDMLDLPGGEVVGHRKVGNRAAMVVDQLVTVGERARWIADEGRRVGLNGAAIFEAETNEQAIEYLRHRLRPGDNVLVKGSPELEMQTIVRAIRLEG